MFACLRISITVSMHYNRLTIWAIPAIQFNTTATPKQIKKF